MARTYGPGNDIQISGAMYVWSGVLEEKQMNPTTRLLCFALIGALISGAIITLSRSPVMTRKIPGGFSRNCAKGRPLDDHAVGSLVD